MKMKKLLVLAAVLALLVGVMVMAGSSWQVIDADPDHFPQGLDDTQTAQFAVEVSALILETVDPQELSPAVRAQLQRFIVDAVIDLSYLDFQVEQLGIIKTIWIREIKDQRKRIEQLERICEPLKGKKLIAVDSIVQAGE